MSGPGSDLARLPQAISEIRDMCVFTSFVPRANTLKRKNPSGGGEFYMFIRIESFYTATAGLAVFFFYLEGFLHSVTVSPQAWINYQYVVNYTFTQYLVTNMYSNV